MIEPKFKKGDYIINHNSGDIAVVKEITKKGYYQFYHYYGGMLKELKDKGHSLQVNYQKFFDLCTEEEKNMMDNIIEEKGEN
jgi:hypothetical protein